MFLLGTLQKFDFWFLPIGTDQTLRNLKRRNLLTIRKYHTKILYILSFLKKAASLQNGEKLV